jgi:hypothetical protein
MLFTPAQLQEVYGVLRARLSQECSAADIRIIAIAAGWESWEIPDGLDETRRFTSRASINSAIDGQWGRWDETVKVRRLRLLARELSLHFARRGGPDIVNEALVDRGFRFENGDFVPVDATGKIPA